MEQTTDLFQNYEISEQGFNIIQLDHCGVSESLELYDNRHVYHSIGIYQCEESCSCDIHNKNICDLESEYEANVRKQDNDAVHLYHFNNCAYSAVNQDEKLKSDKNKICIISTNDLIQSESRSISSEKVDELQESKYSKCRDFSNADPFSSKNSKQKQNSRWSKLEDVNLFKIFNSMATDYGLDCSTINLDKGKVHKSMRKFFKRVKVLSKWRGTLVELKARIKKIKMPRKFTDRDIRVLRRLLRKEREGLITMEQVLEQFPGKTIKQIADYKQRNM